MRFVLLPGQRHDTVGVAPLIEDIAFGALLGDKAFDADWVRAELDRRGAVAVIPPKANRKTLIPYDKAMYRWRHLVENFFAKLKEFRAIAVTGAKVRARVDFGASPGAGKCDSLGTCRPPPICPIWRAPSWRLWWCGCLGSWQN